MQNQLMQRTNDLLDRTKKFALATVKFCEQLPKDETSRVLGRQLLRSGTSVGANYRAAHRANSKPKREKLIPTSPQRYTEKQTSWWRLLFHQSTLRGGTQICRFNTPAEKIGPKGSAFCILRSAFPSGPYYFNKEQTPLAILRYQPTVSRWFFRCLGAHLLRSPLDCKMRYNKKPCFLHGKQGWE